MDAIRAVLVSRHLAPSAKEAVREAERYGLRAPVAIVRALERSWRLEVRAPDRFASSRVRRERRARGIVVLWSQLK